MNVVLWVVQSLLAAMFLFAGFTKATQPRENLIAQLGGWVEDFSAGQVKTIGILEVLAAFGLILPALTGILPVLTPIAAACLVITMIGAIVVHVRRKENSALPMNLVLLVLAAFVAWGRFGPYAF
ncbi:DoxX family protein [Streptosporangium amethystogenes]|uniref:DoxX family protein n=1 Tax=Streptosporangium amethystogenes TaxID=2002 RepID=UPI0004C8BD52|nr:DoxX family protein [Streptosporangium amethystogenes]